MPLGTFAEAAAGNVQSVESYPTSPSSKTVAGGGPSQEMSVMVLPLNVPPPNTASDTSVAKSPNWLLVEFRFPQLLNLDPHWRKIPGPVWLLTVVVPKLAAEPPWTEIPLKALLLMTVLAAIEAAPSPTEIPSPWFPLIVLVP
jgi:hypothetical protein